MRAFKILAGCLAIASTASWAQGNAPSHPLKRSDIQKLAPLTRNYSYICKGQPTLCLVPIHVRARTTMDPEKDQNGNAIYCIATIDYGKVRTARDLALYFVLIDKDVPSVKKYRFWNTGLHFSAGTPDVDHSRFERRIGGDTMSEWWGGSKTTSNDGWEFLPYVYFNDGTADRTCHAADPLIANDG